MKDRENLSENKNSSTWYHWFLNNRFSIFLINLLLFFLVILVFNKISFVLNPVWTFFDALLPPVLLAVIQYYLMNPLVDWLEKRFKVPRMITIVVLFAIVVLFLVWVINSLVPVVQEQATSLVKNWPTYWRDAQNVVKHTLYDPNLRVIRDNLNDALNKAQKTLFQNGEVSVTAALGNIGSAVSVVTMVLMTLLTAPFVLFFMLKDGHQLRFYLAGFAPKRFQKSTADLLEQVNRAVSDYVRGQIMVAFWVGVMFAIGYTIVGQPYGILLAVIAGVLNMIPYFGTFIALIPSLVIALMDSTGMLIKVLIVFAVEQTIESRVVSPLVMGNKMNMHPITTILLLIGASAVSGLWGVVFAIPIYAIIKIITTKIFHYYQQHSAFYDEKDDKKIEVHTVDPKK